jgi:uncharacterized protein DUF861
VTRGQYRVTYGFHEHATLLDGDVALTNEQTGMTVVYGRGDSWIIAKGTRILWDIRSDIARKSYLAVTTSSWPFPKQPVTCPPLWRAFFSRRWSGCRLQHYFRCENTVELLSG